MDNSEQSALKPTPEQLKTFWEWCGFVFKDMDCIWLYPSGEYDYELPPIDPNSLFEYAIPKLRDTTPEWWDCLIDWAAGITGEYEEDILALFWSIYAARMIGSCDD